jgi:hypothetical protein
MFTIYWNGQPVPDDKDLMHTVSDDPLVQERLWDAWSCIDAFIDSNPSVDFDGMSACELADWVSHPDFQEAAPVFAPLPEWLRQNRAHFTITA